MAMTMAMTCSLAEYHYEWDKIGTQVLGRHDGWLVDVVHNAVADEQFQIEFDDTDDSNEDNGGQKDGAETDMMTEMVK